MYNNTVEKDQWRLYGAEGTISPGRNWRAPQLATLFIRS